MILDYKSQQKIIELVIRPAARCRYDRGIAFAALVFSFIFNNWHTLFPPHRHGRDGSGTVVAGLIAQPMRSGVWRWCHHILGTHPHQSTLTLFFLNWWNKQRSENWAFKDELLGLTFPVTVSPVLSPSGWGGLVAANQRVAPRVVRIVAGDQGSPADSPWWTT